MDSRSVHTSEAEDTNTWTTKRRLQKYLCTAIWTTTASPLLATTPNSPLRLGSLRISWCHLINKTSSFPMAFHWRPTWLVLFEPSHASADACAVTPNEWPCCWYCCPYLLLLQTQGHGCLSMKKDKNNCQLSLPQEAIPTVQLNNAACTPRDVSIRKCKVPRTRPQTFNYCASIVENLYNGCSSKHTWTAD